MITDKIIEKVGRNEEEAFNKIFYEYSSKLIGYVDSIINDRIIAEDIVIEIMEEIPKLIKEKYIEQGNFKSWIYKIAKNKSITYLREKTRKREVEIDKYEYKEEKGFRIEELKEILSKEEYKVIVYKYQMRITSSEIGQMMKVSRDKVNRILKKAYLIIEKYYTCH